MISLSSYKSYISTFTDGVLFTIEHLNTVAGEIMTKAMPIVAPLPSAVSVFQSFYLSGYKGWQCFLIAAAVEGLGFATVDTTLKTWSLNVRANDYRYRMRLWIPIVLCFVYLVVALAVIAGIEAAPRIMMWYAGKAQIWEIMAHVVPVAFPFLTAVGAINFAYNEQLRRNQNDIEEQVKNAKTNDALNDEIKRLTAEVERLRNEQAPTPQTNVTAEQSNEQAKERRKQVVVAYKQNPNASYQEVANGLGVNKSVVWNDVKWLAQNEIVHVSTVGRKTTVTVNGNEPQFMAS